jgi:hypothetical protein
LLVRLGLAASKADDAITTDRPERMVSDPSHPETMMGYGATRIDLAQRKLDAFALLAIRRCSNEFEDLLTARAP